MKNEGMEKDMAEKLLKSFDKHLKTKKKKKYYYILRNNHLNVIEFINLSFRMYMSF